MSKRGASEEEFTDLASYQKVNMPGVRSDANVIKRVHVVHSGVEEIHRDSDGHASPDVVVHRDGDVIVGIDFVCKCGHSASIRLEYDEEQPTHG
jgi:hypothetical protein